MKKHLPLHRRQFIKAAREGEAPAEPHQGLALHRRTFITVATATAAAGILSGRRRLHAADSAIRENEHFFFRGAPEGPYIDSQLDNKAFGFGNGKIFLSDDNAKTWAYSSPFADAENITFSCL